MDKKGKSKIKNGKLILTAPKTESAQPDIAFKIRAVGVDFYPSDKF
jgi:hypothetical protein